MGIPNICLCPDVLDRYIGQWFFVYLANDPNAFNGTQWQLAEVGVNYLRFTRPVANLGGSQTAVFFCHQIVGLTQAPPDPGPPITG